MGKRKISYTSEIKTPKTITLTGRIFLQYRDDEAVESNMKGDLLVFAECKQLHTNHLAEYGRTGFSGYFKVDVFDGDEWQPVVLNEIFTAHEHHFSKTERSIDTFGICHEILAALAGRQLSRTYREHYELIE